MHASERSRLLASISNIVRDYRLTEIDPITPEHMDRWLKQFDAEHQPVILRELDRLLSRYYFSRVRVKKELRTYITHSLVAYNDRKQVFNRTRFLRIQRKGKSQQELLRIADEVLQEDYGIRLDECGLKSPSQFVYLDDGIFTGNRLVYDLTYGNAGGPRDDNPSWIPQHAPNHSTLLIFVLAAHAAGTRYALDNYLQPAARAKNITLRRGSALSINNIRRQGGADCLWPRRLRDGNSYLEFYLENRLTNTGRSDCCLFRPSNVPSQETLFSSSEARDVIERAFLLKGCELAYSTHIQSMRPLGFEKLESLGLGTLFVTYRNIANNAPLVLWWGSRSGNRWYPLFEPKRQDSFQSTIYVDDLDVDQMPF